MKIGAYVVERRDVLDESCDVHALNCSLEVC
ncbi:uncharacterized protein G2W53_018713 [Senna tora]|uniref:Uncharacterized protein n=1 Tax=Senna tora TaxID=362788 RepID=A0A834U0Z1_9FABA|nr:uncharacterized protein G2W53_018713 [Senna tora]